MKKSFVVIGIGRFGLSVAETLENLGADVLAIDQNNDAVSKAIETVSQCIICDSTNAESLKKLSIKNIDHAIVAIGSNIQATILTTIALKELGVKKVTVRVDDMHFSSVIKKLGADEVISPELLAGEQLANRVISDNFIDHYNISDEYAVIKVKINGDYKATKLREMNLRSEFNINIAMITRNGKTFMPDADSMIVANDDILIIGKKSDINRFDRSINK